MNEEDDNTKEIAIAIFSQPPRPPNTIQLNLEEQTADIAQQQGVDNFIFDILSIIIMHGIEILFNHNNISKLSENDFNLIQEYTNSFGYKILKKIDDINHVLIIGFEVFR